MSNEERYLNPRSWLSLITRHTGAPLKDTDPNGPAQGIHATSHEAPRQTAPLLPPRSRAASCASDGVWSASTLVRFPNGTPLPESGHLYPQQACQRRERTCGGGRTIIDPLRMDMAITTALRARQEDSAGNHEEAVRMLVASLEHMVASLDDSACNCGVSMGEQLSVLKPPHAKYVSRVPDPCTLRRLAPSGAGPIPHPAAEPYVDKGTCRDAVFKRAVDGLRKTSLDTATRALELANQLTILWLVVLGNMFAWAAVQVKESALPELVARYTLCVCAWTYTMCKQWNVHRHAIHLGGRLVGWLASIDKETGFSYKIICSVAAILGAVARVAEEPTRPVSESRLCVTC
ncbi:hypothetical protein GGI23_000512 [Coemansia sp. RSA 2559]|nr:hypothetical protein GGI23_000512 [Coemansia sp. RSA 2559]